MWILSVLGFYLYCIWFQGNITHVISFSSFVIMAAMAKRCSRFFSLWRAVRGWREMRGWLNVFIWNVFHAYTSVIVCVKDVSNEPVQPSPHFSSSPHRTPHRCSLNVPFCVNGIRLVNQNGEALMENLLEYPGNTWDPHHTKYIDKLESVQRRAARFVTNQPHRRSEPVVSVTAMIQDLGWEPLSTRRLQSRLTSFYKVLNHHLEIPQSYHPVPAQDLQDTRGHDKRFQTYQPEIDAYKFSFFPRTVVDWNKLPAETVHAESIEAFKLRLCASRE